MHGGTCDILANHGYYCKCLPGWKGDHCEFIEQEARTSIISVPEFNGTSYIQYPRLEGIKKALSIEVWIQPYTPNGLVVYTAQHRKGTGDFFIISLIDRHVQLRFNLGSGICNIT